jgi:hypothetical protein
MIGDSPVTATLTDPVTVKADGPAATSAAAPLVPAGQAILVIVGAVAPTAGAVADTFSVTDVADGVGTHLSTPGAVMHSERGTDGIAIGPIVVDAVAAANAVPDNATQQPIAARTMGTGRGTRILVTS